MHYFFKKIVYMFKNEKVKCKKKKIALRFKVFIGSEQRLDMWNFYKELFCIGLSLGGNGNMKTFTCLV